jgi:DeoR/GlpR family transcriptional regulator of sugar metabolism
MHRSATRTIVLADSTKFGKASLLKICPFEEVDTIVTDSGISPQMESRIRGAGAKLIIA